MQSFVDSIPRWGNKATRQMKLIYDTQVIYPTQLLLGLAIAMNCINLQEIFWLDKPWHSLPLLYKH